jgi:hypothetical protein
MNGAGFRSMRISVMARFDRPEKGVSGGNVMVRCLTVAVLLSLLFITQRVTSGGAPLTVRVQIEATRMRTEMAGPNGPVNVMIFDGGKQLLYIIDPARKTYMEMTKADVDRLSAQMQKGMAQMQAQLETLPPAQRAQMEAMMKGVQHTRTGSDTVGRWTCDKYDLMLDGQKIGETCSLNLETLGFRAADFRVMEQMGAFYSAMAPQMAGQLAGPGGIDPRGNSDFPVKTVMLVPGGAVTTEVIEAGRQTFSDSVFAVPAGFTKQDLGAPFAAASASRSAILATRG